MKTETYLTTKQRLLDATVPKDTRTYKAVSHQQLIDISLEAISNEGFIVSKEMYTSAREGNVANAKFTIQNVADSEMQLQVGWQNSYDKSLSLKFALGTQVIICSNGMVKGDYGTFKKKHQGVIQEFAPSTIIEYIKGAGEAFSIMQKEREAMKQIELDKRAKAELLGRLFFEEDFLRSTQLNIIERELKNPTHDYGCEGSMWELYNFTTFSMKNIHPSLWMENHINVHKFFMESAETLKPKPALNLLALV